MDERVHISTGSSGAVCILEQFKKHPPNYIKEDATFRNRLYTFLRENLLVLLAFYIHFIIG